MADYMNTYCSGGLMLNNCAIHIHLDSDGVPAKIVGEKIRGRMASKILGLLQRPLPTNLIEERPIMVANIPKTAEELKPLVDQMKPNDLTTIALLLHAMLSRLEQMAWNGEKKY